MYLFFEEDGTFKTGTILSQNGNAYQVELTTGRRTKVKGGHVFFEFESPAAADLLERAQALVPDVDIQFLWEVAPAEEIRFDELAAEYFGAEAGVVEKVAALLALHANPVYFHRKGRGSYRRAPENILKVALQALEKKRLAEEQKKRWVAQMIEGEIPEEIARNAIALALNPDKNSMIWKALSDASSMMHMPPLRLLLKLGAIRSAYAWHLESFYAQYFPRGKGFPAQLSEPTTQGWEDFAVADVRAFSIDDSKTTEIDDALSVESIDGEHYRIGIHISAPSLGIERDSDVDQLARSRLSTVYAPGLKTTMLPDNWVQAFSLDAGRAVPCLSLYSLVNAQTFEVESTYTRLERINVVENVRYDKIEELFTEEALSNDAVEHPWAKEIGVLWRFAKKCLADREAVRGRPEVLGRLEWGFELEGDLEGDVVIHRCSRTRGAPLDLAVGELMIFANSIWGGWLEDEARAGIYRSQSMGRVKMSTTPGPHDGMGLAQYAWCTSPLRRYVDLVNQRQLISAVLDVEPAYRPSDTDLFSIVSNFVAVYGAYSDFQRKMERYWSLRWIEQEKLTEIEAVVVKGELIRIEGLPFTQRLPGLPELERGQKILLSIKGMDYVDVLLDVEVKEILNETDMQALSEDEDLTAESASESDEQEAAQTAQTAQ